MDMRPNPSSSGEPSLRTDASPFEVDYGDILSCIHCGLCLPSCPTYQLTGEEQHSPRGRIQMMRSIADGKLDLQGGFSDSMAFCLGCFACETACPAGVDYSRLFEAARAAVDDDRPPRLKRAILRQVFTRRGRLRTLAGAMRLAERSGLRRFGVRSGLLRRVAPKMADLEPMSPPVSPVPSDRLIGEVERPTGPVRHRVQLLTGCVMNVAFADVNRDTADVLLAAGCEVHRAPDQECCGSLHGHNGDLKTARDLARRNIAAFEAALPLAETDAVVVNAAGCGAFMKDYGHLLSGDAEWAERAELFASRVRDISEFLASVERPASAGRFDTVATYHDACHLVHAQRVADQPRALLGEIPGLTLVPLRDSTNCCGSAGIYNVLQPEASMELLRRKMEAVAETGASLVITGNPGCAIQIKEGARRFGPAVEVMHPVTVLRRAWLGRVAG
jgi:glycolate oxidase iron-sulfur subunit